MHGQPSLICTNLVECKYWPVHTAAHLLVEGYVTICKHITSFSVIKVPAALLVWKPKMRASFKWIFFYFNKSHCYFYSSLFWKKDFLVRLRVCEDDGGGSREGDSFLWFFSPQVVSFISFVVCLDLKGGDRLQALFSPRWSHVSQPGNDWNLRSHLFCSIFSMPQPKRGEIESSFGGKSITGEKKTITLLQARPPSVMVKRSCGVMITNIQHCSLLPSEMKFWSWNSN